MDAEALMNRLSLKISMDGLLSTFGFNNILVLPPMISIIGRGIVHKFRHTMMALIQLLCGGIQPQADPDRMSVLVRNEPGGTSLQNMIHWLQMSETAEFKKYDFGAAKNLEVYGQEYPPFYDLDTMRTNIRKIPTMLVHGTKDSLVTEKDFEYLVEVLEDTDSNTQYSPLKVLNIHNYGHNDYIWASSAKQTTNIPIGNFLKSQK